MELDELTDRLYQLEKLVSQLVKWTKFNPATENGCGEEESKAVIEDNLLHDDNITIDEIVVKVEHSSDFESSQQFFDNNSENVLKQEIDTGLNERDESFVLSGDQIVESESNPLEFGEASSMPPFVSSSEELCRYQVFNQPDSSPAEPPRDLTAVLRPRVSTGHGKRPNITRNHDVLDPSSALKCKKCGRLFKTLLCLKRHNRHVHKVKSFRCEEKGCNMRFVSSYLLRQHVQRVHKSKPFACPVCSKKFCRNELVDIHVEFSH